MNRFQFLLIPPRATSVPRFKEAPVDAALSEVTQRAEDSFRDVYLTMVSIIQGVALAYLVETLGGLLDGLDVDRLGRLVAVFALIAAVWQEYMIGSTMYAWIPGTVDVLAPFLLGIGEGLMIATISGGIVRFLLLTACTFTVGYAAEVNYAYKALTSGAQVSEVARRVIVIHPRTGPAMALSGAVLMWLLTWYTLANPLRMAGWLAAVPATGFLASAYLRWTRPMRSARRRTVKTAEGSDTTNLPLTAVDRP